MSSIKFEISKESGAHHKLARLCGEWEGTNKTWFEPGVLADESPVTGMIRPVLDGRFVLHEYRSSLAGNPFEGMAIYGYALAAGRFESAWIDSFHMGTGIMLSGGGPGDGRISLTGGYGAEEPGKRWQWRTEIELVEADRMIITAYNISPEGVEAKAVETIYKRKNRS